MQNNTNRARHERYEFRSSASIHDWWLPWEIDNGQWTMENGQWTMDSKRTSKWRKIRANWKQFSMMCDFSSFQESESSNYKVNPCDQNDNRRSDRKYQNWSSKILSSKSILTLKRFESEFVPEIIISQESDLIATRIQERRDQVTSVQDRLSDPFQSQRRIQVTDAERKGIIMIKFWFAETRKNSLSCVDAWFNN
jgi:hypothetical protein